MSALFNLIKHVNGCKANFLNKKLIKNINGTVYVVRVLNNIICKNCLKSNNPGNCKHILNKLVCKNCLETNNINDCTHVHTPYRKKSNNYLPNYKTCWFGNSQTLFTLSEISCKI